MDPNKTLEEIRLLISEATSVSKRMAWHNHEELADRIKALDDWITSGGFLPTDWEINSRPGIIYKHQVKVT